MKAAYRHISSVGAKDMVLYSTYIEICNQICPDRLFNHSAEEKEQINWVFLMLGQTLELCIAPFFQAISGKQLTP
jgi:hypothetical protein